MGKDSKGTTSLDAGDWRRRLQATGGPASKSIGPDHTGPGRVGTANAPEWRKRLGGVTASYSTGVVVLAIDRSTSMAGANKMRQAIDGARGFAERARALGYRVGLVAFSTGAERLVSSRQHEASLTAALERISADGTTDMAGGVKMALTELEDSPQPSRRVICLVTDGRPDDADETLRIANEAKNQGVDIMVIGTDDADHDFLAKISTSNDLARKVDASQLQPAIANMALLLPKL